MASPVKVLKNTALAIENSMPPGKPRLHVVVTVTTPTGGWTVKLARANPQGINKKILLLKIVATPPSGPATQVITKHNLRYDENPAKVRYTNVTILGGSPEVTVPVYRVS